MFLKYFLLFIPLLISIGGTFILATFSFTHLFGAPFVATRHRIVKDMLRFAELKKGESIADVGSGSGSILVSAVRDFDAERAVGYEINPFLVFASKVRAQVLGISTKMETYRNNFFKTKIKNVDVVAVYLWPNTMDKLRVKLKIELSPDTRIISRGFTFNGVKIRKHEKIHNTNFYMYLVEDL
jgi:ribosomal protein L11 methylase PrmA